MSLASQLDAFGISVKNFYALCKPRVTALIVFTALIGMFMATPGMVPWDILMATTVGVAFSSGAAAAFNCLIEHKIDAVMARTRGRPLPTGQVSNVENAGYSPPYRRRRRFWPSLRVFVNPLTMWLTLATCAWSRSDLHLCLLKPARHQ